MGRMNSEFLKNHGRAGFWDFFVNFNIPKFILFVVIFHLTIFENFRTHHENHIWRENFKYLKYKFSTDDFCSKN